MKIKTLNVFSVVINRTVPKRNLGIPVYPTPFGTMLNRIVPKHCRKSKNSEMPFGTMLNRMVPKPRILLFNMIGVD